MHFICDRTLFCPKEDELRKRIPVPHDNYLKSAFKFRSRAAKVILVCCFHDPRGLLQVNGT